MAGTTSFPDNTSSPLNQTTMFANISNNVTETLSYQTTTSNGTEDVVDQEKAKLKQIFDIVLIVSICLVMMALGCTVQLEILKAHLRRPIGMIIGLVSQFIVFPAVTFGLAHALRLEKWNAIGMILLGTSPGGALSNLLTYYCDGDVTLSICMTATSTVIGIGMMPLNSWIYSRSWADSKTVVPIRSIIIGLATLLIPVGIGMLIVAKFPKVAEWVKKIGSGLGMLLAFGVVGFFSYLFPQIYSAGWQLWLGACVLSLFGITLGYILATIFRLPHASRRAIAIETGVQNVGLCLALVAIAYGPDLFLEILVFPVLFATVGFAAMLVFILLYKIQKILRTRLGLLEKKPPSATVEGPNIDKEGRCDDVQEKKKPPDENENEFQIRL